MQGPCKISKVLRLLQVFVSLINIESHCVLGPWVPLMSRKKHGSRSCWGLQLSGGETLMKRYVTGDKTAHVMRACKEGL